MECPDCGSAMEEGFLQSPRPITFVKQPRWLKIQSSRGDYRLPFSPLRGSVLPASSCPRCGKIIISVKDEA